MISIVMATYNRATTLMRAVNSVLAQSLQDWELIIVDDGSTDETSQILARIDDSRVSVQRHPTNRGVTAAKNTGLDQIRGDWFTTLDSDDEITPDAFAVMLECAEETGATAITCNCADSVTGKMSGTGPTRDCWLTSEEAGRSRGEFWGLTKTSLLGDLRFDERLPGFESTVWLKINLAARRYYLHSALRIYHTEGADRVTVASRHAGTKRKVTVYAVLGEDRAYLEALKAQDPRGYRRTMLRVWAARLLQPFLG
jgi:glycosyltransferase involved in cell wall biosynthesis